MNVIRPTIEGRFPKLNDGFHDVALGNMTQYRIVIARQDPILFVGIVGKRCYEFTHQPHYGYVIEKLGLLNGDAMAIADFIGCQINPESWTPSPEHADNYRPNLCHSVVQQYLTEIQHPTCTWPSYCWPRS